MNALAKAGLEKHGVKILKSGLAEGGFINKNKLISRHYYSIASKTTLLLPRSLTKEEIVNLLYFPVVNEGFKCLEKGMAMRPSDIDGGAVFSYSWPRDHRELPGRPTPATSL